MIKQILSTFGMLILSLIMLIGLSLPAVPGTAQEAQPSLAYRYGYVSLETDNIYNLYLVDPDSPAQAGQVVTLPFSTDEFVFQSDASPNGQWMSFVFGRRDNPGFAIRLLNLQTGEVRDIAPHAQFSSMAWSPDSNNLAFIATDAVDEHGSYGSYVYGYKLIPAADIDPWRDKVNSFSSYVYNLQSDRATYLLGNNRVNYPFHLSWSPDGTRLAVVSKLCSQNPCQGKIDVFGASQYRMITSANFNTHGDILCNFTWSPDNHYLSFVFSCGDGVGTSLADNAHDIFTWDMETGSMNRLTSFTPEFTTLQDINYFLSSNNSYDLIWYNPMNLLVGISAGRYQATTGYDRATVQLMTNVYQPDGSSTQISGDVLGNWVRNPVNDMLAFRAERKGLSVNKNGVLVLTNQAVSVQVAAFNENALQSLHTLPVNGCELSWSPDGAYLAAVQRESNVLDCPQPVSSFNFLNQSNGKISQFLVPNHYPVWSGWVAVPVTLPSVTPIPTAAPAAQPPLAYRYGYLIRQADTEHLHLLNPDSPTRAEQVIPLPVSADDFVSNVTVSPNGQWLSLILGTNDSETGIQIRLFNVLTGEIRYLPPRVLLNGLAWSPDSRYLAVNMGDAEIRTNEFATYVYDVQTNTDNYVLDGDFYRYGLSWSPDSTRLAVASIQCSKTTCQGQIDVVSVPNYQTVVSTPYDAFSDLLCNLSWSPDNRYFSFVFSCGDGQFPYISDVFTLDTATNAIRQETTFTQELEVFLEFSDPSKLFRTFYDIIWYDSERLLVGVSGGRFVDGIGYDPATVQVTTNVYHPDGTSAQLSSAMLTNWVSNPVNNLIAFRSEQKIVYTDEQNMPQLTNETVSVQVATLNGDALQILYTQPTNGCDLSWSPDGVYLAYTHPGLDTADCFRTLTAVDHYSFLNTINGQTTQTSVSVIYGDPLGWIAVPANSLPGSTD